MPRKTRRRNFGSQSSISKDEFIQILFEVRALTCFGSARCFLACSPSSWTSTNSLNGGKGGKKGDSGHFADFLRDFLRGRNVSGQGKGQGKTAPKVRCFAWRRRGRALGDGRGKGPPLFARSRILHNGGATSNAWEQADLRFRQYAPRNPCPFENIVYGRATSNAWGQEWFRSVRAGSKEYHLKVLLWSVKRLWQRCVLLDSLGLCIRGSVHYLLLERVTRHETRSQGLVISCEGRFCPVQVLLFSFHKLPVSLLSYCVCSTGLVNYFVLFYLENAFWTRKKESVP